MLESKKDVLDDDLEKEVSEKVDPEETEEVEDKAKIDSSKEPEGVDAEAKEVDEESASKDKDEPETKEVKEPETKEVEQIQNEEIKEPETEEVVESKSKDVEEPKSEEVDEPKSKDIVEEPKAKEPVAAVAVSDDDDLDDLDISPEEIRKHLEAQPIYIFTSLAGGMQIMPRTNRLATILQANGIKFEYRDLGTDEEAKKIWKRQANGKTLPGVVRGMILSVIGMKLMKPMKSTS